MTVIADTGAVFALLDANDRHHRALRRLFEEDPRAWVLPWAILPELDFILARRLGRSVASAFRRDVRDGLFAVEWHDPSDLARAVELDEGFEDRALGLVDGVVMAMAERLGAHAIATLDLRDFEAVELRGRPDLWPRDLPG